MYVQDNHEQSSLRPKQYNMKTDMMVTTIDDDDGGHHCTGMTVSISDRPVSVSRKQT